MPGPNEGGRKRYRESEDDPRPRLSPFQITILRIRREIVELGEPSKFSITSNISHLAKSLTGQELDTFQNHFLSTIEAVIIEQPHKTQLLAGSITISNSKSPRLGALTLEYFHSKLQEYVEAGKWNHVKLITRFLVNLQPIVDGYGIVNLLKQLLERAISLQVSSNDADGKRVSLAEELYTTVLLDLPFLRKSSPQNTDIKESVSEILVRSQDFPIADNSAAVSIIEPFIGSDSPYRASEFVKLVRGALNTVDIEGWTLRSLLDIHSLIEPELTSPPDITRHVFPAVNIPEIQDLAAYSKSGIYAHPRLYFQAYLPTIYETVPTEGTFESVILRDLATDIIGNMDFNRREVARQLITLDLFFAPNTFAEPGISFDKLGAVVNKGTEEDVDADTDTDAAVSSRKRSTWKIEDVALESVLDHIFKTPHSLHPGAYYHSILIESCIMAPQAIAPVFGRAIRFLYSNITSLDFELFHRFLAWFSHHLSNFGFTWKWLEWQNDVQLSDLHPKKVFISQLILKEVRLSYIQRVRETLPEPFWPLLPVALEEPIFKYLEPDSKFQPEVQKILTLLREGAEIDIIKEAINEIRKKSESLDSSDLTGDFSQTPPQLIALDALLQSVCYLGNRSWSHADNWVSRARNLLIDECGTEAGNANQVQAVESVLEYWKEQPYVGLLIVGLLITADIVSPIAFLDVVFNSPAKYNQHLLISNHGWEAVTRILDEELSKEEEVYRPVFEFLLKQLSTKVQQGEDVKTVEPTSNGDEENVHVVEIEGDSPDISGDEAAEKPDNGDVAMSDQPSIEDWTTWWYKGATRSILRKYSGVYSKIPVSDEFDDYIKDLSKLITDI